MLIIIRILKAAGVIILILVVLLLIAGAVLSYMMRGTGEPKDIKAAKAAGDRLLARKDLRILILTGHPDDVDWYMGGTAGKLARNGNLVVVAVGTSGEKGGDLPDLGKVREEEQQAAADIMGYSEVIFYRFPDRGLEVNEAYKDKIKATIEEYNINTVFSFDVEKEGPLYHHSDHRAAGRAAIEIGRELDRIKEVYLFYSSENDVLVDTGDIVADKSRAMSQHRSQRLHGQLRGFLNLFSIFSHDEENQGGKKKNDPRSVSTRINNTNVDIARKAGIEACELFRRAK